MKTTTVKPGAPAWHIVDASNQTLGKVAVVVARILRGKHKPTFSPHQLCGDHVVIVNAQHLTFEGNKPQNKMYYSHTGYPGGFKKATLEDMMKGDSVTVIEKAIQGMLPRNRLRREMLKRLHVFADDQHPYAPQQPTPLSIKKS